MARPLAGCGPQCNLIRKRLCEYSRPEGQLRLCHCQTIDAGAEVFQDEILLGGRLAVVDLLGPLFKRQFDPECLVDGEGNVKKIETVDSKIVYGVAFRFDPVAGNVARLRNYIGHRVES